MYREKASVSRKDAHPLALLYAKHDRGRRARGGGGPTAEVVPANPKPLTLRSFRF